MRVNDLIQKQKDDASLEPSALSLMRKFFGRQIAKVMITITDSKTMVNEPRREAS